MSGPLFLHVEKKLGMPYSLPVAVVAQLVEQLHGKE